MMTKGLIIGLGNAFFGSDGFSLCVLESLAREPFSAAVRFLYPGDDPRRAGGWIYGMDWVVVVGLVSLGGPPGRLHAWPLSVFRQHILWMAEDFQEVRFLAESLARADLADGLPEDVWFMWMEAPATTRSGRPAEERRAVWRTTRAIKDRLIRRGFLPERASVVTPICRFDTIQPAP